MATLGALNNTTTTASRGSANAYFTSVTMPEDGTLDSMSAFLFDLGSSDDYRYAVYTGGTSDSDINGATLVWDSGLITAAPTSSAFNTITAGGESLSSGARLWLAVHTNSSVVTYTVASPDHGDLNLRTDYWASGLGYLAGGFPSTAGSATGAISTTQAVKAFITYTAGGGGGILIPVVYHHRQTQGMT